MKKLYISVRYWKIVLAYTFVFYLLCVTGCNGPALSSVEQIRKFEKAGPRTPVVDVNEPVKARITYIYRVVPGDVLELQMPAILRGISSDSPDWLQKVEPYSCRVSDAGTITLPIVGKVPAAGKTLAEVESSVVDAYFPKYVVNAPAVVCKVTEHLNQRVFTVLGLVKKPDAFPYPPNVQYNLMEALAFAGGVNQVADPRYVSVYRQAANGDIVFATFRIDRKFLADAYNIVIKPGDVVCVNRTARTHLNTFLSDVFSLHVGAYVHPYDF